MSPDVSFFIPVRNGVPFIRDCIESVFAQSFQNWRLYVVDNRSSDATESLCRPYAADQRFTYLRNDTDLGAVGNYNKCLTLTDTKYYAILSHDDYYCAADAVAEAFGILEADPDVCAVYSHLKWVDTAARTIAPRRLPLVGRVDSDRVARASIISCRNLFGVPLLVRRSAAAGKEYDRRLYHTVDIDFSVALGSGRSLYTIDRECYAIRFHERNNTMRRFSTIRDELTQIAVKHGFRLGTAERLRMSINDRRMRAEKAAFYFYLDHLRPLFSAAPGKT